jgi:hypothetical protein
MGYKIVLQRTDTRKRWKMKCPENSLVKSRDIARWCNSEKRHNEREWAIILYLNYSALFEACKTAHQNSHIEWLHDTYPELVHIMGDEQ